MPGEYRVIIIIISIIIIIIIIIIINIIITTTIAIAPNILFYTDVCVYGRKICKAFKKKFQFFVTIFVTHRFVSDQNLLLADMQTCSLSFTQKSSERTIIVY